MSEWQPIETAPKDGTWAIVGWFHLAGQVSLAVGFWHAHKRAWCDVRNVLHGPNPEQLPTHWMPIPDPPQATR